MKKLISLIFFGCIFGFLTNCPINPPAEPGVDDDTTITERVDILFQPGSEEGVIEFQTNDPEYTGGAGHSLWTLTDTPSSVFHDREIWLSKLSGHCWVSGYGAVYCQQDNSEFGVTFIIGMIALDGYYCVGEVIHGTQFSYLVPWTKSDQILTGYSQNNQIRLEFNSGEDLFHFYINGIEQITFRDDEEPVHREGRQGYIVVISPNDIFPETPVRIQFKEIN
jgi:hypothetical protein